MPQSQQWPWPATPSRLKCAWIMQRRFHDHPNVQSQEVRAKDHASPPQVNPTVRAAKMRYSPVSIALLPSDHVFEFADKLSAGPPDVLLGAGKLRDIFIVPSVIGLRFKCHGCCAWIGKIRDGKGHHDL